MKSAYLTLGVPGNATQEDIDIAHQIALTRYSKARLVERPELAIQLQEVEAAYRVLRDPELRSAHDRKLMNAVPSAEHAQTALRTSTSSRSQQSSTGTIFLIASLIGLVALTAAGGYISKQRAAKREAQERSIAVEREKLEAEAERQKALVQAEQARARADRDRQDRLSESAERRLRAESQVVNSMVAAQDARTASMQAQAQLIEQARIQRAQMEAASDERRRAYEAQQRVEADKRRIRELCYQNYRRYDC